MKSYADNRPCGYVPILLAKPLAISLTSRLGITAECMGDINLPTDIAFQGILDINRPIVGLYILVRA